MILDKHELHQLSLKKQEKWGNSIHAIVAKRAQARNELLVNRELEHRRLDQLEHDL